MKMLPDEDKKPLKVVMKETFVVYFASIVGIYMYAQFDIQEIKTGGSKTTLAFVDNPTF
jgi:hypothetical protein